MMGSRTIHIGFDSAAMLSKALTLIEAANEWCNDSQPEWLPLRNPYKKPWGYRKIVIYGKFSSKQS